MINHLFLAQGRVSIDEGKVNKPVLKGEIVALLCCYTFG